MIYNDIQYNKKNSYTLCSGEPIRKQKMKIGRVN